MLKYMSVKVRRPLTNWKNLLLYKYIYNRQEGSIIDLSLEAGIDNSRDMNKIMLICSAKGGDFTKHNIR
jgi:hypothetical protein